MSLHRSRTSTFLLSRGRVGAGLVGATIVITTLTACTGPFAPSLSASPTPTSSSESGSPSSPGSPTGSPTGSATPSPSVSVPPSDPAVAVGKSCLDLVSLQTMYKFDPNFNLTAGYVPAAGSRDAAAVSERGVACRWTQLTSGDTIDIAAAHPSPSNLAALRTAAGAPAGGSGRYFSAVGGVGTVQEFSGEFWVVATSPYFTRATDAAALLTSVTSALSS